MNSLDLPSWFPLPAWVVTFALLWAAVDCGLYTVRQFKDNVRHPADAGWKRAIEWFGIGASAVAAVVVLILWVALHAAT